MITKKIVFVLFLNDDENRMRIVLKKLEKNNLFVILISNKSSKGSDF